MNSFLKVVIDTGEKILNSKMALFQEDLRILLRDVKTKLGTMFSPMACCVFSLRMLDMELNIILPQICFFFIILYKVVKGNTPVRIIGDNVLFSYELGHSQLSINGKL